MNALGKPLRSVDEAKVGSEIHGMRQFAITLRQDIAVVRTAISGPWNNGQTEGQSTG